MSVCRVARISDFVSETQTCRPEVFISERQTRLLYLNRIPNTYSTPYLRVQVPRSVDLLDCRAMNDVDTDTDDDADDADDDGCARLVSPVAMAAQPPTPAWLREAGDLL